MVHISEYIIGYSDLTLDIATDTGRYLLHKGLDSEVVIDKAAIYVVTEVRHRGWGRYRQRGRYIQGRYIQWAL